jgi:hypothetical protein
MQKRTLLGSWLRSVRLRFRTAARNAALREAPTQDKPRLQFSSGDRQTDIAVESVAEPLPAFALDLHHGRRNGSKQERLIKT